MHRLTRSVCASGFATLVVACGAPASRSDGALNLYLTDAQYRRSELVQSLVNPNNGYSALRLSHYESGDANDWSKLPEWNPPTEPLSKAVLDAGNATGAVTNSAASLLIDDAAESGSDGALIALGEAAFFRYPVQLAGAATNAIHTDADAARFGFWLDDLHGVGGLVRVELPDGTTALAQTCSTCHTGVRDGKLVMGAPNERLDWGALVVQASSNMDASLASSLLHWGPGRLDVTTTDGTEPVRIADLRPVRWLTHLQADATVRQRDVAALAIRIETLIITSQGQISRPPREVSLGLALFVRSLADTLPDSGQSARAHARGAAVFAEECGSCHAEPGLTGPPVPIDVVGTDPTVGRSTDRGTGTYRVPSLHGVSSRGPLFHDGRLPDLSLLLDPNRVSPAYSAALHGEGPIVGHPFGLDLPDDARSDLLAFLQSL